VGPEAPEGQDSVPGVGTWKVPTEMGLAEVEWVVMDEADVLFGRGSWNEEYRRVMMFCISAYVDFLIRCATGCLAVVASDGYRFWGLTCAHIDERRRRHVRGEGGCAGHGEVRIGAVGCVSCWYCRSPDSARSRTNAGCPATSCSCSLSTVRTSGCCSCAWRRSGYGRGLRVDGLACGRSFVRRETGFEDSIVENKV
jgi:hypothetical protein